MLTLQRKFQRQTAVLLRTDPGVKTVIVSQLSSFYFHDHMSPNMRLLLLLVLVSISLSQVGSVFSAYS